MHVSLIFVLASVSSIRGLAAALYFGELGGCCGGWRFPFILAGVRIVLSLLFCQGVLWSRTSYVLPLDSNLVRACVCARVYVRETRTWRECARTCVRV